VVGKHDASEQEDRLIVQHARRRNARLNRIRESQGRQGRSLHIRARIDFPARAGASTPQPTDLSSSGHGRVTGRKAQHRLALSSLRAPPRAPVIVFHHMHHHLCCSAAFNQTMGKIRIAFFRDSTAGHVQEDVESLPLKTAKAHAQADEDKAQELEGLPSYPTQSKTVRFDQLPFIAADEVVKRDGTRGSDICMLDCHPLAKHK
jgi:hypothetical protein